MNSPNPDVDEVHVVVDLNASSHHQPPFTRNYVNNNNGVHHHAEASNYSQRRHSNNMRFDLNSPAEDVEYSAPVVLDNVPVVDAPVEEDYTGSNFGNNEHSEYIDWNRGSIDVAPDGRLSYNEFAGPEDDNREGFDLKAAVQEAQAQDEAYYEDRLQNLQAGKADFQQEPECSFDLDDNYISLWYN